MGAMAPPPHWVPEDDVLLRNAVEAGASLEYLAKGAVQFSRRFTFEELKDRWHSLLYDPVISVEASARMAEVERSSFPNQWRPDKLECGVKGFVYSSGKRKAESVRKCYYAICKRICNEPLMDANILSDFGDGNERESADYLGPDFDMRRHQFFPEGNTSFCGVQNHDLGGEDVVPSYPYEENIALTEEEVPGFNQSKESPLCNLFEAAEGLVNEGGSPCSEFGGLQFSNFDQLPTWHTTTTTSQEIPKEQQTSTEEYLAELSNSLFDLDQPLFLDNDALEKSYLDGLSSLLLDSPTHSELHITDSLGEEEATAEHLVDTDGTLNAGAAAPSPLPVKCLGPEYRNGVICCTLNTEDSEIPSNDDVFLPFRCPSSPTEEFSKACGGGGRGGAIKDRCPSSPTEEFSKACGGGGRGGAIKDSRVLPQMQIGSSDMGLRYPTGGGHHGVKFELPKSNIEHAALRNARNTECSENLNATNFVVNRGSLEITHGRNADYISVGPYPDKHEIGLASLQKNATCSRSGIAEIPNNGSSNAELSSQQIVMPKPIDQTLLSDQEELWSEDEFDVPYFSDVEAMILDMDLSPDEFDISTNPEVQQYQHEESKRTIIRLEQAADAVTQRAIAGQGAFAVLNGRFSKYFIKKPEVLLGRATNDIKVDIDLGREKYGSKISRRQAIMKMDTNGIFHLKNLGQSSIYVNDNKVDTGESINLTCGCLIQVKELAFLFETNRRIVKQFVDSVGQGGLSGGS